MSTTSSRAPCWPSDLTRVCERLAQHLDRSGASHPVAAAVSLAARGHHGLDLAEFASELGLPPDALRRAEAGVSAWEELPDNIGELLEAKSSIDLLALADLETEYRRGG
jgi:hypothetical protein